MRSFSDLTSLKGRVALVSGGAAPVGRAIAEIYAELGAAIAIVDKPGSGAEDIARALTDKYGVLATAIAMNASDIAAVRKIPQRVVDSCGRLDILINSNIAADDTPQSLSEIGVEAWQGGLLAGLTVPFLLIQQAIPALRVSGKASVVNFAAAGTGASSAVSGGLTHLTRALADALAPQVRVNAVIGGSIDDLRGAAAFLASDLSGRMTGQCISLAGAQVY